MSSPKNNGTINVIPTEGLANRLRVIVTSIKLARDTGKKLQIYWNADKGLRADYKQLFIVPEDPLIKKPPIFLKAWIEMNSLSLRLKKISDIYLKLLPFDFVFLDTMAPLVWNKKIDLQEETGKATNSLLCTCQELGIFDVEDYKIFQPLPSIREKITALTDKFNNQTIGIHIRSTDNEQSKLHSPFELFEKKITAEISNDPFINFFVSTDNISYQEKLVHTFGAGKIIFHDKEFSRNSTRGIEDAVIDMFCLSKTSKIYGSYFSSFSDVAGRIGNIPVECLVNK